MAFVCSICFLVLEKHRGRLRDAVTGAADSDQVKPGPFVSNLFCRFIFLFPFLGGQGADADSCEVTPLFSMIFV